MLRAKTTRCRICSQFENQAMIFLLEYDRPQGRIVIFNVFADSDLERAENMRLEIELRLNRDGVDHEVVLLEANSEDALRQTHRRYFENVEALLSHLKISA
jgi:hypothetical protein